MFYIVVADGAHGTSLHAAAANGAYCGPGTTAGPELPGTHDPRPVSLPCPVPLAAAPGPSGPVVGRARQLCPWPPSAGGSAAGQQPQWCLRGAGKLFGTDFYSYVIFLARLSRRGAGPPAGERVPFAGRRPPRCRGLPPAVRPRPCGSLTCVQRGQGGRRYWCEGGSKRDKKLVKR